MIGAKPSRRKQHEQIPENPGGGADAVPVGSLCVGVGRPGERALEEGQPLSLTSPSVILAETSTGTVIFEKNADEQREAASITKLMTALLVLEDLDAGDVALTQQVTVSQNAAAMKGSQALLDANAQYSLEDLLRTTIMGQRQRRAVALAEALCGTEGGVCPPDERARRGAGHDGNGVRQLHRLSAGRQHTTARDVCACARGGAPSGVPQVRQRLDRHADASGRAG